MRFDCFITAANVTEVPKRPIFVPLFSEIDSLIFSKSKIMLSQK